MLEISVFLLMGLMISITINLALLVLPIHYLAVNCHIILRRLCEFFVKK